MWGSAALKECAQLHAQLHPALQVCCCWDTHHADPVQLCVGIGDDEPGFHTFSGIRKGHPAIMLAEQVGGSGVAGWQGL
jgi:hypothetical protein